MGRAMTGHDETALLTGVRGCRLALHPLPEIDPGRLIPRLGNPVAQMDGHVVLRPAITALIRASCDPVLPDAACAPASKRRRAARIR